MTAAFGVVPPADGAEVERLEQAGSASFWAGGHIASPNASPEPLAWMARLVAQTREAVVGSATVVLPLYPPALVAKQIADLDHASGGRIVLGIGVGGEIRADFDAVEVPVTERGARTDEALGLLKRFWSGEEVHHVGRHHRIDGVRIGPAPLRPGGPPIYVSGRSPRAVRRAVEHGDGWMPYVISAERFGRGIEDTRALADERGRDLGGFEWLVYVMVAVDDDRDRARAATVAFFQQMWGRDLSAQVDRLVVSGNADDVARGLQRYVDAGATQVILCPIHGDRVGSAERLLQMLVD